MQLLFLRHGPAESKDEWGGDDDERPLSAQGRLLVTEVAHSLPRLETRPDVIIASPLARARQTAELISDCLGPGTTVVADKRLAPGFGPKQLEKVVREYSEASVLMIVGHDPDLTEIVRGLTGGGRLSIRKGGLAQIEIPDLKVMKGRLVALLVPTPMSPRASNDDAES